LLPNIYGCIALNEYSSKNYILLDNLILNWFDSFWWTIRVVRKYKSREVS